MARGKTRKRPIASRRKLWPLQGQSFYLAIAILGVIGLVLAIYLTYLDYSGAEVTFCSEGSGCNVVRDSEYVNLLGVPVALWGVIGYLAIIGAALAPLTERTKNLSLFALAIIGFTFSVYLTYLELFVIHALCPYCVGSAIVMALTLILLVSRQPIVPRFPTSRLSLLGGGLAVIVILGAVFLPKEIGSSGAVASEEFQVGLAQHLQSTGAVMYSSPTCQYCFLQKQLFGEAVEYLNIVNCSGTPVDDPKPSLCAEKGIRVTPTWEIDGQIYPGLKPLEELAKMSGYEGPVPGS